MPPKFQRTNKRWRNRQASRTLGVEHMNNEENRILTFHGHSLITLTFASNTVEYSIIPVNFGSRLTAVTDAYSLYRFTELLIQPHRIAQSVSNGLVALGYTPDLVNNNPGSTLNDVYQMEKSTFFTTSGSTNPFPETVMPRPIRLVQRDLRGALPWYRTRTNASFGDNTEYQGSLFGANTGDLTPVITCEAFYTVQMKDPVPTSSTFLMRTRALGQTSNSNEGAHPAEDLLKEALEKLKTR